MRLIPFCMKLFFGYCLSAIFGVQILLAQAPLVIDSEFDEWTGVPVIYTSPPGTGAPGQIDFGQLQIANDQQFLFIRIELGKEIILQESNNLQLLIDADLNSSTGTSFNGVGAELIWSFGQRSGLRQLSGQSTTIFHSDIRLRTAPTVSSSVFEFAIDRTVQINGSALFPNSSIRVLLRDGTSGDRIPQNGQIVQYTFQSGTVDTSPTSFSRLDPDDLRLLSWNVRNDGLWNATQAPRFGRILTSIQPDIINFQEIYGHTATETRTLVSSWLPGTWYTSSNSDCKTLSRYPILGSWAMSNNNAMLIDTSAKFGSSTLLINLHLACCDNNSSRENQIDQVLAFIREAKLPGGVLTLTPDTPVIITGDLNLVTVASQLNSLLTGQIVNQATYGPSFTPDWNGQPLKRLNSRHSDKQMSYTWRNDSSTYCPGLLDFHIYTDSVLDVPRHFIVNTVAMNSSRLTSNGLLWNDSWASDHYAFVADYRIDVPDPANIVHQFVYHGGWSGNPSGGPWDAVDPVKILAQEGSGPQTLDIDNLVNSPRGINGIGFDIQGVWNSPSLSASDFVFQMSPQGAFASGGHPPVSWGPAPSPSSVSVFGGDPTRVLLQWPDNSIRGCWLRITVLANSNTGLENPEVFYLGQLTGEISGPLEGFFTVTFSDIVPVRAAIGQQTDPGSSLDIDKNGVVSFADISALRSNVGAELTNVTIP